MPGDVVTARRKKKKPTLLRRLLFGMHEPKEPV